MKHALVGLTALVILSIAIPAIADEDPIVKPCSELLRMAEMYQDDLKTVDTMLASALDGGSMDRIKTYKLKKGAVKKQLEGVLKAIEIRGCVKSR